MRGRPTEMGSRCFEKSYNTSRAASQEIVQYPRAVPPETTTSPIECEYRPTTNRSGVADNGRLPKQAPRSGGEGRLNQPIGTSSPGLTVRREGGGDGDGVTQTQAIWRV